MPSIRQLRDLRSLIPALVKAPRDDSPYIPCWRCNRQLRYSVAEPTHFAGSMGYGHTEGACDPQDIADKNARSVVAQAAREAWQDELNARRMGYR